MKQDIKNILSNLEAEVKVKNEKQRKEYLQNKLQFIISNELQGFLESHFNDNSYDIAILNIIEEKEKEKNNIYEYLKTYYEVKYTEKYNEKMQLIKTSQRNYIFKGLDARLYSCLYEELFIKELERAKKIYKYKEQIKEKQEKESFKKECLEVYNILFEDATDLLDNHKPNKRKIIFNNLNGIKCLKNAWDNIETFLTFEEFSKIYYKVLDHIKKIYNEDLKNTKQIKRGLFLGLVYFLAKDMKKARKY